MIIQRDFHEILHKFQNLDGAEIDAGQDDLQIKHHGEDLEEEDHVEEGRDADVQIVVDEVETVGLENILLPRTEVSIPVEYDEIAVVEEIRDDEADEGEQLKKKQPTINAGAGDEHEAYPTDRIDENLGGDNETESTEDVRKMAEKNENEKKGKEEDEVEKEVEECGNGQEEENKPRREEEMAKEDKDKEEGEGNENDVEKEERKVYTSGWSSPLGDLAEQMFRNQEEMELAVDQTERLEKKSKEASEKVEKKEKKVVSMQQVVRAFSAIRNLKKICR